MTGFRDYQLAIQRRRIPDRRGSQLDDSQFGEVFDRIVAGSWNPTERNLLRRAARAALL